MRPSQIHASQKATSIPLSPLPPSPVSAGLTPPSYPPPSYPAMSTSGVVLVPATPSPPPSCQRGLSVQGGQELTQSQAIPLPTPAETAGDRLWGYPHRLTRSEVLQCTRRDLRASGLTWLGTPDRSTTHDGLGNSKWTEIQSTHLIHCPSRTQN